MLSPYDLARLDMQRVLPEGLNPPRNGEGDREAAGLGVEGHRP